MSKNIDKDPDVIEATPVAPTGMFVDRPIFTTAVNIAYSVNKTRTVREAAERKLATVAEALPDAVALRNALEWTRKSLDTHVDWLKYIQGGHATNEELRIAGNKEEQQECIEKYNHLCAVLRRTIDARQVLLKIEADTQNHLADIYSEVENDNNS